jgi:FAD/FMN-containing dehydrogenase
MAEETPVGSDKLRIAIDRLPISIPTVTKGMPDSLLVQFFAAHIQEMVIPYADAAAFMLNNLQPVNAMSRHRIGLALPTIPVSDDDRTMAQFPQEVIPASREAVNREVPESLSDAAIRPTAIRAKRYQGIDYDHIPVSLVDAVIEPGDTQYARVKSTYMRGGSPGIVFQVTDTDQIVDALAFARWHPDVPLGIRSGGHGISGRSTNHGGIIIDLSRLNKIEVLDEATRRVRIEPGARWGDVAATLAPYGWALSSGDYGGVGVGGLATSGGLGWLAREHGLTIDRLRAVDMILADGTLIHASDEAHQDLFWAVRGAGANFGIVTSFEFEVNEIGEVGWAQLALDASNTADFLEKWGAVVESSPRDLTSFLIMGPPRRGQPTIAQVMAVVDSDQPDVIINRLEPIARIAPLYDQQVVITSYASIMADAQGSDHNGQGEPEGRSGLIEHITPKFAQAIERLLSSGDVYFFQIRSVGGAVSDIPSGATAYGFRSANFSVAAAGTNRERMNRHWDKLAEYFEGMYLSFDTDLRPERLNDAFPPATLERLRTLKQQYDPENVFRDNFNIAPSAVVG